MEKKAKVIQIIIVVLIVLCCCAGTALTLTGPVFMEIIPLFIIPFIAVELIKRFVFSRKQSQI